MDQTKLMQINVPARTADNDDVCRVGDQSTDHAGMMRRPESQETDQSVGRHHQDNRHRSKSQYGVAYQGCLSRICPASSIQASRLALSVQITRPIAVQCHRDPLVCKRLIQLVPRIRQLVPVFMREWHKDRPKPSSGYKPRRRNDN